MRAAVAGTFAVPLVAPAGTGQYPRSPAVATFVVDGQVAHPRTLTVEDLRQFPEQRVRARFGSGDGREEHRYRGALLLDVLEAAQPQFDPETKNDALRHAVLVTASEVITDAPRARRLSPGPASRAAPPGSR